MIEICKGTAGLEGLGEICLFNTTLTTKAEDRGATEIII